MLHRLFSMSRRALSILPLALTVVQAQGAVSGTVIDDRTGLALVGVSVRIASTGDAVITNPQGRFVIARVPAGEQEIVARYLGFAPQTAKVSVSAGRTATVAIRMKAADVTLETVVVSGQRTGQAAAIAQQQNNANITNIVAADQIGRFPDANIGDALKRIPGINVSVDQGEARFGQIRGTEPRLNSITINGERMPSPEGDNRSNTLDLIPADMVQQVEVSKTLTPDMDADAIGGSVNIVTRAAPAGRRISYTLGSGYNALADRGMTIASGVVGQRFFDNKFGAIFSGSWFNHFLGSDNIEANWEENNGKAYTSEFQVREYQIQRLRRSASLALDFSPNANHQVFLRGMYNHRDDWENRYRLTYVFGTPDAQGVSARTELRRQTKGGGASDRVNFARLEDQRVWNTALSGDHLFASKLRVEWSAQIAQANENRPDERYIDWRARNVSVTQNLTNERQPSYTINDLTQVETSDFTFRRGEALDGYTQDRDANGRIDFTLPILADSRNAALKFGARIRTKDKYRDNRYFRYAPVAGQLTNLGTTTLFDATNPDYLAGNYRAGVFSSREFLGRLDLQGSNFTRTLLPEENVPANFSASEAISAGYAMLSGQLSPKLSAVLGLRAEQTNVKYNGFELDLDNGNINGTTGEDDYLDILPSLSFRYDVDASTVLRAAWTNSIARPNYYDLVPYRIVSRDDDELAIGNPTLKATKSMNFDFTAERYFTSVGLLSGGVFYKDISDFIFNYIDQNATDVATGEVFRTISAPRNGAAASLVGIELAVQRQLDFLPGALKNLGIYANYTFTDSKVENINIDGRQNEDLELPGTTKHSGNVSLSYDAKRLSARVSYNFQGSFLDPEEGLGESAFYDRYYDGAKNLDLNASWTFSPRTRLFLEANNLTNQPLRYYQGTKDRIMQNEYYDRRVQVGLKVDL